LWTFDEKGIAYLGPIREIGRKDALRMQPDQEFQSSVAIRGVGQRIGARYRSSWKRKLHELPGDEFRRASVRGIILILENEPDGAGAGGRDLRDARATLGVGSHLGVRIWNFGGPINQVGLMPLSARAASARTSRRSDMDASALEVAKPNAR